MRLPPKSYLGVPQRIGFALGPAFAALGEPHKSVCSGDRPFRISGAGLGFSACLELRKLQALGLVSCTVGRVKKGCTLQVNPCKKTVQIGICIKASSVQRQGNLGIKTRRGNPSSHSNGVRILWHDPMSDHWFETLETYVVRVQICIRLLAAFGLEVGGSGVSHQRPPSHLTPYTQAHI